MKLIETTTGDVPVPKGDILLTFTMVAQTENKIYSYIVDSGEEIYSKFDCDHCTLSNLTALAGGAKPDYSDTMINNLCYLYVDMYGAYRWDENSFAAVAKNYGIKLMNKVEEPMVQIRRWVRYIADVDDVLMPDNFLTIRGVEIVPLIVSSRKRNKETHKESHCNYTGNLEMLYEASEVRSRVKKLLEESGIYT